MPRGEQTRYDRSNVGNGVSATGRTGRTVQTDAKRGGPTKDHSLSAQWEHTVLVTAEGFEILTLGAQDR